MFGLFMAFACTSEFADAIPADTGVPEEVQSHFSTQLAAKAPKACSSCGAVPCGYCQQGCRVSRCFPAKTGPWKGKKPHARTRNDCGKKHGIRNWNQTPPGCLKKHRRKR